MTPILTRGTYLQDGRRAFPALLASTDEDDVKDLFFHDGTTVPALARRKAGLPDVVPLAGPRRFRNGPVPVIR